MIHIHEDDTPESAAAVKLRELILRAWPWVEGDPQAQIEIVPGVKCHGQSTRDLDIVLLGYLPPKARFVPFLNFMRRFDRQWIRPASVRVESLCIVLELKDSDPGDVRFIGSRLEVSYRNSGAPHWSNVSEQNHKQVFALKGFLVTQGREAPWITNLIWLSQMPPDRLPTRPHNILGSNLTWELLLNVAAQMNPPQEEGEEWVMRSWEIGAAHDFLSTVRLLTQKIEPTRLDRVRMARITESAVKPEWLEELGKKQLIFRGRGGTGKTMLLLQMAWRACRDQGARVLILTYNTALLADLRRLLTLVGDIHGLGEQSIQAQTIMAFFASAFRGLGLIDQDMDYLESYSDVKQQALGLVTSADISKLIHEHTEAFEWDYVFIDEAQDWPEDERDLLRRFYPSCRFVLADGVDQFVRAQKACDWQGDVAKGALYVIPLATCLRMKANLATFANQLAAALGLAGWKIESNDKALGGHIVVVEGDYFARPELHGRIVESNAADGNQPVDMLMCVPPGQVRRGEGKPAHSLARATRVRGPTGLGRRIAGRAQQLCDFSATTPHRAVRFVSGPGGMGCDLPGIGRFLQL